MKIVVLVVMVTVLVQCVDMKKRQKKASSLLKKVFHDLKDDLEDLKDDLNDCLGVEGMKKRREISRRGISDAEIQDRIEKLRKRVTKTTRKLDECLAAKSAATASASDDVTTIDTTTSM